MHASSSCSPLRPSHTTSFVSVHCADARYCIDQLWVCGPSQGVYHRMWYSHAKGTMLADGCPAAAFINLFVRSCRVQFEGEYSRRCSIKSRCHISDYCFFFSDCFCQRTAHRSHSLRACPVEVIKRLIKLFWSRDASWSPSLFLITFCPVVDARILIASARFSGSSYSVYAIRFVVRTVFVRLGTARS